MLELEVSQGLKSLQSGKKRVKVNDIMTIGEDATIVRVYTEADMQEQGQSQGIQGAFNKAKEQAPGVMQQAKSSLQEVATVTKEKFNEIKEHPKTQQAVQNLTDQAQKAKETIKEKTQSSNSSANTQPQTPPSQGAQVAPQTTQELPMTTQPVQGASLIGKYATRTIALPDGSVFIRQGDIIAVDTIQFATQFGLVDQLALNAETERVITPTSVKDLNTTQIIS